MVLETDSPYLIPTKARGSHNTPRNIPVIARFLADVKHSTLEQVAIQTTENAERFFGKLGIS
jgi:TatD DNase family protein